jgi:hypothetical protein
MREFFQILAEALRFGWCARHKRHFILRFLPIPPRAYVKWRLDTVYGEKEHGWKRPSWRIIVRDTWKFLKWRRKMRLEG